MSESVGTNQRDERPRRSVGSRGRIPVGAVVVLLALCFAGAAAAAFHTIGGVYHGLGSTTGGGIGSGQPMAVALNANTYGVTVQAGMYNHQFDGGWTQQCFAGPYANAASCNGTWGDYPCRKYAWTEAFGVYAWHGHSPSDPACI